MINNFYKTKLAYKVLDKIQEERSILKSELVAYSNDPVRYDRRFRMLTNLAEYEVIFLSKLRNFVTDDKNDLEVDSSMFPLIQQEIMAIVNRDA